MNSRLKAGHTTTWGIVPWVWNKNKKSGWRPGR